ncbi:condensin-2 complex subunit D3-L-like, partial [Centroberyx affinis]|uniref:condensin-2 complex subunit D3-L-like n=1 Tax=Centroberyx affinis TaxID=166261 RepID=UPI003A5C0B3D
MELIPALQFLKLKELPSAWVDAAWDFEFTEIAPLDATIEEELSGSGEKAFRRLYQSLLPYAAEEPPAGRESVWALLGESGGTSRSLVAALSFFVLRGKAKASGGQQRVSGLQAASLYLLLLGIP